MRLRDIKLGDIASPAWQEAWRTHEEQMSEYIRGMYAKIDDVIRRAALRDLGREPAPEEVRSMGQCLVHKDGRREWAWNGRTIAVMYPWVGQQHPLVEIFEP